MKIVVVTGASRGSGASIARQNAKRARGVVLTYQSNAPLQYQKQLHLQEARRALQVEGVDVTTAGLRVRPLESVSVQPRVRASIRSPAPGRPAQSRRAHTRLTAALAETARSLSLCRRAADSMVAARTARGAPSCPRPERCSPGHHPCARCGPYCLASAPEALPSPRRCDAMPQQCGLRAMIEVRP